MSRIILIIILLMSGGLFAQELINDCPFKDTYYVCEKEREVENLGKYHELVSRDGNRLILKSDLGDIYRDNSPRETEGFSDEDGNINANYYFYQYLEKQQVFVVARSLWEGSDFELISKNTKKSVVLPKRPVSSPDNTHHIAFVTDNYESHTYHVVLWEISESKLSEVYEEKIDYNFVMKANWLSDNEVALVYQEGFSDKMIKGDQVGSLSKSNGKWVYRETKKP